MNMYICNRKKLKNKNIRNKSFLNIGDIQKIAILDYKEKKLNKMYIARPK